MAALPTVIDNIGFSLDIPHSIPNLGICLLIMYVYMIAVYLAKSVKYLWIKTLYFLSIFPYPRPKPRKCQCTCPCRHCHHQPISDLSWLYNVYVTPVHPVCLLQTPKLLNRYRLKVTYGDSICKNFNFGSYCHKKR